ncbi:glycosyltransferase family 4 protein [Spirosoma jeollabukense]
MTVTYIVRSPGTGHSIEALFDSIQPEVEQQGIQTNTIQLPHISRGLRSVWKNLNFVKKLSADVFHITGDVHYVALALPASRTILTIHDCRLLETNRNRPLRYAFFWLFWYYFPIKRAAIVTVVSEKTRQDLWRYVGRAARHVHVIPNSYDPLFTHHPRPFCTDRPVLLQIGTAPHKNLARLLAAIEEIRCTLVVIGPLTQSTIADLHQRRIQYLNHANISRSDVVQCYVNCDIVTFVSTYEGFGMPIIEANAIGRVVITANDSPMRDVADGAAHVVDPTDIAAIRQGILTLIQDATYRETLIQRGLQNARNYTVKTAATRYEALYRQAPVVFFHAFLLSLFFR